MCLEGGVALQKQYIQNSFSSIFKGKIVSIKNAKYFYFKKELLYFFKKQGFSVIFKEKLKGGDQVNARCQRLDKVIK